MFSPVHASAGILIARFTPNPATAFALALVSHFLIDAIPHGDESPDAPNLQRPVSRFIAVVFLDSSVAVAAILILIFSGHTPPADRLIAGVVGSITPDGLWGLEYVLNHRRWRWRWLWPALTKVNGWHVQLHVKPSRDVRFAAGLGIQFVLLLALMAANLAWR